MGRDMMRLSTLAKTWIFDLDGVLTVHNGHLADGEKILPGVAEFAGRIGPDDTVILLSSRDAALRDCAVAFLAAAGIRVDHAIFGLPFGERILFNDKKPSGLPTAYAVNLERDEGLQRIAVVYDPTL
jgi:hypothetical protein